MAPGLLTRAHSGATPIRWGECMSITQAEIPALAPACLLCTGYPDGFCFRCKNTTIDPDPHAPVIEGYAVAAAGAR